MANANNPTGITSPSLNLLPKYFQTPANKKFLQATIDQLFQPGSVTKTSGFIGRENAKAAIGTDNYISAADTTRQNYQLEPGITIRDSRLGNVKFFKDYIDYINQIGVFGGNTKSHQRLNSQEFYSWDPHIDWDKFVNFQNYYWLPYGPEVIKIYGQQEKISSTISVELQNEGANNQYVFTPDGFTPDPILKIYKGHTYTFVINSPGNPFSIKLSRSIGSIDRYINRNIDNYAVTDGTITFTVPLDAPSILYYQSETDINLGGSIEVFSIDENSFIDVEKDFLGKQTYKLTDGTAISNGMKVSFGGNVTPASYGKGEYYVDGVGTAIRLVPTSVLEIITPYTIEQTSAFDSTPFESEPFSDATGYASVQDYITINRTSRDHNPWSRYNRWFHQDVIKASCAYNNIAPELDQKARATRPIIEFVSDLKLFNFGTQAIADVDLIDNFTVDVFSTIEGSSGYNIDGVDLVQGHRILVTADIDPLVVNKVYEVTFVDLRHLNSGSKQIHLVEAETPTVGQTAIIKSGKTYYSQMFWFNGTTWVEAQQKTNTNQAPLFDIVDNNGISYGDTSVYNGSTFKGTQLFSYKVGNSINDSVLGFPLSYQNVANIGDIVFNFNLATDSFQYKQTTNLITQKIDVGFLVGQDYAGRPMYQNGWQICNTKTVQAAVRIYKNSKITNNFNLDIFDDITNLSDLVVRIYVNGQRLNSTEWKLVDTTLYKKIVLNTAISLTDVLTIKAFAAQPINSNGYYEIPINLQNNPLNDSMADFTLGEVTDHLNTIVDNIDFIGAFPGESDLRDLGNITQYGTRFVQHSGPLSLSLYHITSENTNVIKAIETARDDYNNFKRNFLSIASNLGIDADPVTMVDLILQKINANKPNTAPYYFTDMVPYGAKLVTDLPVVDGRIKKYPLTTVFNLDTMSNKAVGVYLNQVQLVYGTDYTFDSQGFIDIIHSLVTGDTITTYEYESTDGCFIPSTPTKLGMWPKYEPKKYLDTTLLTPVNIIQGHDGSLVLAYNDYRDDIILELEKRIFNNIKVQYDPTIFDINDIIPSYNRTNDYSRVEFEQVLAPNFYKWTGLIGSDFTKPLSYDIGNPFTYNYKRSTGPTGGKIPGYWRGIYKYLLDTDRPNICPWEMLGFSIMPSWWISVYGPSPYTKDNLVMWQDISEGIIREPGKPLVYQTKYAKPFLMNCIPVDESGNLLNPTITGLANGPITPSVDGDYVFGDVAPVENAWRRSSYYPFSVIAASLLLTPAKTFGTLLDRSRIVRNLAGQLIYKDTGSRLRPMDIILPSIYSSENRVQTSGIINYVIDLILNYIFSNNLASYNSYETDLALMTAQLSYRVGAFTNQDQFNLLLESKTPMSTGNVFIPKEDYSIFLNTSSPVKKLTYSGVMITKLQTGYQVRGYSRTQPYFYYYDFQQSGSAINVGGISQTYSVWTPGQQYIVGSIVEYNNKYYRTVVANTESTFDTQYFQVLPGLPAVGGVDVIFRKIWDRSTLITVPYGTEFSSAQEVVDFLLGYGEYLKDQGFVFDDYNSNLESVLNWETSAKEFLFWSTQNWSTGQEKWSDWKPNQAISYGTILRYNGNYYSAITNIPPSAEFNADDFNKLDGLSAAGASVISLSPSAAAVTFTTTLTVVDDISNKFNNYEIFKVDGTSISPKQMDSYREGNTITYAPRTTDGIYSASFYLIQNEHVVTIKNTDIFNDVIYNPPSGYRRERIKVSGYVTTNWYGGLDIPGFIFDAASVDSWQPWQDYNMGDIILHQGHYYSANKFLAGSDTFVSSDWSVMSKTPSPVIMPNWTNLATQFTDFYSLEVDNFDSQQQKMAQHLIGYQKRQYLENIIQDDVSEFKFYQGMVREKGTQNVLNKLFNVLSSDNAESLMFYEEWALRVGQYGANRAFEDVEFVLDEGNFNSNPQAVALVQHYDSSINDFVIQQAAQDVYLKPAGYNSNPFPVFDDTNPYKPLLRSAGYVNPADVLLSLGTIDELTTQDITKFNNGDCVWVAFEGNSWNVYRYTDMNITVENAIYNPTLKQITISTKYLSGITAGMYIGISQVSQFSGFYKVESVNLNSFVISKTVNGWINPFVEQDRMVVFAMISQRTTSINNLDSVIKKDLLPGEIVWTDDAGSKSWGTWKYNPVYSEFLVNNSFPSDETNFGLRVSVNKKGDMLAVGDNRGNVVTYYRAQSNLSWAEKQLISAPTVSSISDNTPVSAIAFSPDGTWLAVGSKSAGSVSSSYKGEYNSSLDYGSNSIVKLGDSLYRTLTAIQHEYIVTDFSATTTSLGSGAIFDVVVVPTATRVIGDATVPTAGYYNVVIKYGGIGYAPGNKIKISGTQLGGISPDDDLTITIPTDGVTTTSSIKLNAAITISGSPSTLNNEILLAKTTPGVSGSVISGAGATLRIITPPYGYRIAPNSGALGGTRYSIGDTITVLGSQLGGVNVVNDFILTVSSVDQTGAISNFTVNGQPSWQQISYIPSEINRYGQLIESGYFSIGNTYEISVLGTTDWNYIANTTGVTYNVGDTFVARQSGKVLATDLQSGSTYVIIFQGTSNFLLAGASSNAIGTAFIADAPITGTGFVFNGTGVAIEQIKAYDSTTVGQGIVTLYKKNNDNFYSIVDTIISEDPVDNENFGATLVFGQDSLYVGALGGSSYDGLTNNVGRVYKLSYGVQKSVSATYNPVGSSGVTLVVSSTNPIPLYNVSPGMLVTGTGFISGQYVLQILSTTTLILSAPPTGTPDGTITFKTIDWGYNSFLAGTTVGDNFGRNIQVSADNSIIAISTEDGNGNGIVQIFKNGITLQPISGTDVSFGTSLSVSDDGVYIVVGDGTQNGTVNVYKFNGAEYGPTPYQTLVDHYSEIQGHFGNKVAFMNGGKTIAVYSQSGNASITTTFDSYAKTLENNQDNPYLSDTTSQATTPSTYDKNSTLFVQTQIGSGRVDIYDMYGDKWVFSESLQSADTSSDGYGIGFSAGDNTVVVGAPYATDQTHIQSGQVYSYVKPSDKYSWTLDKTSSLIPIVSRVKKAFLYNKNLGTLVSYLDTIDPLQGKIAGVADEEIKYKSFYDPAVYSDNPGSVNVNADNSSYWSKNQIGQLWWNLSTAKFVESYFDDVNYRNNSWNKLAPGASIDIYEWVESKLLPAQWDAQADTPAGLALGISGTSLYGNNVYSVRQQYNNLTKAFVKTYYFWVKNKSVVPHVPGRNITALDVASLIANPRGQSYSYLSLLGPDSFSLTNTRQYLKDKDVVLAVEYWLTNKTDQNIHSQWKLISNDPIVDLPLTLEQKWFDSLCGVDSAGRGVPDLTQPPKLRYGVENRPRQSMFVNRIEALKEFVERTNRTLILNQISENYNISALESYDTPPTVISGLYDNTLDTDAELPYLNITSFRKAILNPVITNGTITSIDITFAGSGYLIAPTVTIDSPGKNAVLKTTINSLGQITNVSVVSGGFGYDISNTTLTVRTYCVLVKSDSVANNNWSIYAYDTTSKIWSRILTQAYDVRNYWNYVDWYATGYSQYSAPDHAVDTFVGLNTLQSKIGELVKVRTVNAGGWLLLEKYANSTSVDWTQSYNIVGIQNGTIQLSTKLYNFESTNIGYDSDIFDGGSFDVVASTELRIILNTIKENIFIGNLKQNYLDLFIAAIHYAHSEQVYIDWAFKTSFVRATHNVGKLDQPVNYPVDNIANFEDYVSEVKPYRTKLREYISNYTGLEVGQSAITDFDLQPVYSNNKVVPVDTIFDGTGVSSNNSVIQTYPWKFWNDNLGFVVTDLVIISGGSNYITPPQVIITSESGSGATAQAFIVNGAVSRIVLTNPGTGYLSTPTVTISGGLGPIGISARVIAVIGKGVVRGSLIGIKFDRTDYTYYNTVLQKTQTFTGSGSRLQWALTWAPDTRIGQNTVTINGIPALRENYKLSVIKAKYNGYTHYTGVITFLTPPSNQSIIVVTYKINQSLLNAVDRIQYYYNPTSGQLGKDLTQLLTGTDYGGVQVNGLGFNSIHGWDSNPFGTDTWDNFDSNYTDYFVTATADQLRSFTLPYQLNPGTEINVYHAASTEDRTTISALNSNQIKFEYNILATTVVVTSVVTKTAAGPTTTYNPVGSYYTTLTVSDATGILIGMAVVGTGFTSGQTVTYVDYTNKTLTLSKAPDSTPTGVLTFTYNYAGSNKLTLNSVDGINLGDVVTSDAVSVFAYDTVVENIDTNTNTITLGTPDSSTTLNANNISGDGHTVTITFDTQKYVPFESGTTIIVTGFIPNSYNGIYKVTNASFNFVSFTSLLQAPSTTIGTVSLILNSVIFKDPAQINNYYPIVNGNSIQFTKLLKDTIDMVVNNDGTVVLLSYVPAIGAEIVITGKTSPVRLDDPKFGTVDQKNSKAKMQTPFPVFSVTVTSPGRYTQLPAITFSDSDLNAPSYTASATPIMKAVDVSYNGNNLGTGYTVGDILVATPQYGPANVTMINSSIVNSTLVVGTITSGEIYPGMILTGSGIAQFDSLISTGIRGDGTIATITFATRASIPFALGQYIEVSGFPNGFNGKYIVTDVTDHSVSYENTTVLSQTFVVGTVSSVDITYITGLDPSSHGTGNGSFWTLNRKLTTASTTITGSSAVILQVTRTASFTEIGPIDELQILSSTIYEGGVDETSQSLMGGTGQNATITLVYGVDSVVLANPGSGYLNNPTITFEQGIETATATATIRQVVNSSTANTVVTISDSYPVTVGDEFVIRQASSDGSVAPADQDYDTSITGGDLAYTTATGILADDIIIDGDGLVTPTSSPAPEEVMPGQVVDTLAIKVYDQTYNAGAKVKIDNYVGDGSLLTFAYSQLLNNPGAIVVKVDNVIKVAGVDYNVSFNQNRIVFVQPPAANKIISIFTIGINGQNILDGDYFICDGITSEFITRAKWLDTVSSVIYLNGVLVNPILFKTDNTYSLGGMIGLRFSVTPAAGSVINYIIVASAIQTVAVTQTELLPLYAIPQNTFKLDNPVGVGLPAESNMIVIVDNTVLEAPANSYFTITSDTLAYTISADQFTLNAVQYSDVRVYIDKKLIALNKEYVVDLTGLTVTLRKKIRDKNIGKQLVVSIRTNAEYSYDSTTGDLTLNNSYDSSHKIQVLTSYNHDILDLERTTVNISSLVSSIPGSVDYYRYQDATRGIINLNHTVPDEEYAWIIQNGRLLTPLIDYQMLSNHQSVQLTVPPAPTDKISVLLFNNNVSQPGISYMQFKDMLNRTVYKRLALNRHTLLAQELNWYDTQIVVKDGTVLTTPNPSTNKPGVIEIAGERIEYFKKDLNVLSQLRRGTLGTGVRSYSNVGTSVQDIGIDSTIPYSDITDVRPIISDGVTTTFNLDLGFTLDPTFTDYNSLFEVFVGGQDDLRRLKKYDYVHYNPTLAPYSPTIPISDTDPVGTIKDGDEKFAKEFVVSNVTTAGSVITLANVVTQGTQITIIRKSGQSWDGDHSANPVNILNDVSNIASFLKATPGIWYTGFNNNRKLTIDSSKVTFDSGNVTLDKG